MKSQNFSKLKEKLVISYSKQIEKIYQEALDQYRNSPIKPSKNREFQVVESFFDKHLLSCLRNNLISEANFYGYLRFRMFKYFNIANRKQDVVTSNFEGVWNEFKQVIQLNKLILKSTTSLGSIFKERWEKKIVELLSSLKINDRNRLMIYLNNHYRGLPQINSQLDKMNPFLLKDRAIEKEDKDGVFAISMAQLLNQVIQPSFKIKKNLESVFYNILSKRIIDFYRKYSTNSNDLSNEYSQNSDSSIINIFPSKENKKKLLSYSIDYDKIVDYNILVGNIDSECFELLAWYNRGNKTFEEIGKIYKLSKQTVNKRYNNCIDKYLKKMNNE